MIGSRGHAARARSRGRLLLWVAFVLCLLAAPAAAQVPPGCPAALGAADLIQHDLSFSFCELCSVGDARLVVENPFDPGDGVDDFTEIVVTEDLRASGLTYVPSSTNFSGANLPGGPPIDFDPVLSGPANSILTWTFNPAFTMPANPGGAGNRATLVIDFQVERDASVTEEGLVAANRDIRAQVQVTPECSTGGTYTDATPIDVLPLREPEPRIQKRGRNLDAGQGGYSDPVYAHEDDDVIWRIRVFNDGQADLQDFVFSDSMAPGNYLITHVCSSEAAAVAASGGGSPGACVVPPGAPTTDITDFDVRAAFGGAANPYIVAPAGGFGDYFLVGVVTDSCTDRNNTVFDVEWGCQEEPPPGGISATSGGQTAGDVAELSTLSVESGVDVSVALTGTNTSQPMGGAGLVTITIANNSGGTIKHADAIRLSSTLPEGLDALADYVIDTSFPPQIVMAPAYGNAYPGMVENIQWTNPQPGTFPYNAATPGAAYLANTDLAFRLTSNGAHPDFPDQVNMIRHGDVVTITYRTVLIDSQYYDRVANLDVRTEEPASDPPGTDPTQSFAISSQADLVYQEFCDTNGIDEHLITEVENDTANPEDLDVDMSGAELVFILTNTGDPLPLTVELTNNGGHDADDYFAYVSFGEAMTVQTAPAGCAPTANPPAMPVWQSPVTIPATASVYQCDRGVISPGETETLNFEVVKNTAASFDDDLTFRADVIGEITLDNGEPLWFPDPIQRPDGITDRANTYSVDALWARVVGFNLFKTQVGTCTENNPPPASPDDQVEIGEECTFNIESGGWFGFETPGFTYIAVQNIQVVDQNPDGQGYISSTNPAATSTSAITDIQSNPAPSVLGEADFGWTHNTLSADRIEERDHWFRVDFTSRLLNDPIDTRADPNQHANLSTNILNATFDAIFFNDSTGMEELYNLGPNTVGFPREFWRRVDLVVTEPLLTVTKEVCNETLYGVGVGCTNFVPLADDGDAFDTYIFRIRVENEAAASSVTRAPAYDVTVTSVTDPGDQIFVEPLPGDTVDNDGDALIDGGDAGGEGTITDNTVLNGTPAQVIASFTHSDALLRIDPGQTVELYYRVDPDDDVAPLQALTNTVTASYDSLEGPSGAQTAPQGNNGEAGGARQYVSQPGQATIQIIPVEVQPKRISALANSALVAPPGPQPVSIGEEVEFEINALIPVSQLRSFEIRDELPPGITCSEAPVVDLDAPPYSAGGFMPGGSFVPTCTDTEVVWSFGDQIVSQAPGGAARFSFTVGFIARVDNELANQDGNLIRNGGTATTVTVSYIDEQNNPVVLDIDEAALLVQEPVLALTKDFSVAEVDAGDRPRVTVTLTNNGTAAAYNPRVLDDLSLLDLSYVGDIQGAAPPTADLVAFGPDQPLFGWPAGFAIAPGEVVSFSFAVEADLAVQPQQVLQNTIQADWTSLPGQSTALNSTGLIGPDGSATGMRIGALPNAGDPLNDYETEADASVSVPAPVLDKIDVDPALTPAIGAHKPFEVAIDLPEGTTQNVTVRDALDSGVVSYVLADNADFDITYLFEGIATINGQPPSEAALLATPADGASGTVVWSVGEVVTQSEDDLAVQAISPRIRIQYFARINNDLVTDSGDALQNGVEVEYRNGDTGLPETLNDDTPAIAAIEPVLTATKLLTNVTPGKNAADPPAFGDTLEYLVTVLNGGNAAGFDVNIADTPSPYVELVGSFVPTAAINGVPVAGFVPTPSGAPAGPFIWGKNNGDESLDLPVGGTLELTYRVFVRALPPDGSTIDNTVWTDWTSLDGPSPYERTGDGCPTITPPDDYCFGPAVASEIVDPLDPPDPLVKAITQPTATIGEAFTYQITIPANPFAFDLNDVRISDDLTATGVDLRFLSVTRIAGSGTWTPQNTGTPTGVLIEDPVDGIDIPAGEQITLEIELVLEDTLPGNVAGVTFANTAGYVWNWIDDDDTSQRPGQDGTSELMTIVEPDLTMTKTGPAVMTLGTPGSFTLDVHNPGGASAWFAEIDDVLPDSPTGGTCDAPPSAVVAQVFEADGTTPVSAVLVDGVDYSSQWTGVPTCTLELAMLSAAAAIGPDQRLIVTYDVVLDSDTQDGESLINVAGATRWFSTQGADPRTVGDRREYTRTLSDGTPAVLDHEDDHEVLVALPEYLFEKTVANLTSGADPATTATPGDRLQYTLRLENLGPNPIAGISIHDELDRLNTPAAFAPGSLVVVSAPAGADTSTTDPNGGPQGTGLLEVRGLALAGGVGENLEVVFEVTLAPVLADGSVVANQSELRIDDLPFAVSDDPNVNGQADPAVPGDEDPTQLVIQSMPDFQVEKISAYLTGDPTVLLAGETLRYTITVKNVGTENASDAALRDAVPVNTSYVPGSTTLNGVPVPDGPGGTSPLAAGILLNAPEDPTPGAMRADASATPANVATLVFDVVVDPTVLDGTIISNQAFVSAPTGGVVDQPSDDPRTPQPGDPTRDVVGNAPLLFAPKSAALFLDNGSPGLVDPGDILEYTIQVQNTGAADATAAMLRDNVPVNTTYLADTTTLNGLPLGQPDAGVFPLIAGVDVSSSNLTPPLPGPGAGIVSVGELAEVRFRVQVNAVPAGTIISNQATFTNAETPDLLTDGDGDPSTGPEPTIVVVGDAQQLAITKQVSVVGGGPALPGAEVEYVVRVQNISAVPAIDVVITDDLDDPVAGQLNLVLGSATLNGLTAGVTEAPPLITADYSTTYGPLAPGGVVVLRFRATLDAGLAFGTTVTNVAEVRWNDPPQTNTASVSIDVGGMPGVGTLAGALWHDADFDGVQGGGEIALVGWNVELLRNGAPVQSVTSDANGAYQMTGLVPNDTSGDTYGLRFSAPDAGPASALLGYAISPFTNGLQSIDDIVVASGGNLTDLSLPISPNGVVYDAIERTPVPGAVVQLLDAGGNTALPAGCFDDANQQGQITRSDGYYRFDLNFSDAACPSGSAFLVAVTAPGASFGPGISQVIPPTTGAADPALSVPACPGSADDAIPAGPAGFCEAQPQETAPPPSVPPRSPGTNYHLHLTLAGTTPPGTSQIFNNHIPLDPVLGDDVSITKTTPLQNVSRGQLVPYSIVVRNALAAEIPDLSIIDRVPAGFRYVEGSARVDGTPTEPDQDGLELTWLDVGVPAAGQVEVVLLLAVGAGVAEGEFTNRAQAFSSITAAALSAEAQSTVRVVPDPTFDCTDVLGKVFDDADRDGVQDRGERGLAGVRLATARGLLATTDSHGRFHITCAVVPREDRGQNFVLKLDDRTLPSGYRMTTRQVQTQRATRGKALRFSFGASVLRVVGLDLANAVFEPDTAEMRPQWRPRLERLVEELARQPSILRLSYVADTESEALVKERLAAVEEAVARAWEGLDREALRVETEVYWRLGAPPGEGRELSSRLEALLPSVDAGPPLAPSQAGSSAERHLPTQPEPRQWSHDPERLETLLSDRLEEREVVSQAAKTVKLKDVVPPIRFESGVAQIPPATVHKLRRVLDDMRHLENVRVHLVGHADDEPLSAQLAGVFGDNRGLSRERAGEAAEFLQAALGLPPEAISFAWAGEGEPIASNATEAGRALNRRVEVEVWYDEREAQTSLEEVLVEQDFKRIKICRTETVCKLRYREGHAHRSRVKNLIAPLPFSEESVSVPADFVRKVSEALHNLRHESGVTVKFIGYTDDAALEGRAARVYGTHLALSKAQAQRVALAIRDAIPGASVASDGRGSSRPLASNETARGRALNNRVEVEFWHDDPLAELPEEPQLCPDAGAAEVVTQVYDPPWGPLPSLPINGGAPVIPPELLERARRALDEIADRTRPRLRFVGYTKGEQLDRRTAAVYGDDVGLSTARARRAMEAVVAELGLDPAQAEHEGRGFVHARDVVNAGFLPGDSSYVRVEAIYDDLAILDDTEGVEVTPITRELRPQHPLSLNLMRITVDGEPLDDPGRSSSDIQRCTDVALDRADIRFRFDDLRPEPRLSVTSDRPSASEAVPVRFRMASNYGAFFERAEVRLFEAGASTRGEPLWVVPLDAQGLGEWRPEGLEARAPQRELAFLLRVYDGEGRFDETETQPLWLVPAGSERFSPPSGSGDPLRAGHGESGTLARNIPLGSVGSVKVDGEGIPPEHTVMLAGTPVPVDAEGRFAAEVLLPAGTHTVEVAVLDGDGNGELFLRDLEFRRSDWFYVGIADFTFSPDLGDGPSDDLFGRDSAIDPDSTADGRLAFYLDGKFGDDWKLTASADTREEPLEDLFSNFLDKSPEALFRRIDPDYHYPTFGDDGTVEETAPTSGKFYAKLSRRESHALWGNFEAEYLDNELAHVDRGLYGGNLHYESESATHFGERRFVIDGFAADPGTVGGRDEFRGTGGSLYFLRRQDILVGSERLRVEVRDKVSGIVTGVVHLRPTVDYDIDYIQGRVMLTEPIASTVADQLLVRDDGLSGNEAFLVAQYEFTPGVDELDTLALGGRAHAWLGDYLKLGVTANDNDDDVADSSLYAADVTARWSAESWLKLQAGQSEGPLSSEFRSLDGGFDFAAVAPAVAEDEDAVAYRGDVSVGLADFIDNARGRLHLYAQQMEAGYSAPGQISTNDTQIFGGLIGVPVGSKLEVTAKADHRIEDDGLTTTAEEVNVTYHLTEHWDLAAGVRHEDREDDSPVVPVTQEEGQRTDAVVQVGFDTNSRWRTYAFGQATVAKDGDRDDNHRGGVGGAYRISDQLTLDGEASYGSLGPAVQLGTRFQLTEDTQRYLSYALENERGYDGVHARRGNLISGIRTRLSDSSSVYLEDRYQHGDQSQGLARAMGITLAPAEHWSFGANWELGTLLDPRTNAETDRNSGGARVSYHDERKSFSSAVEYRFDEIEQPDGSETDRTTWLFRNSFRFQMTPGGRLIAKLNHSMSDSSEGSFFDGGFTEGVLGYAYRPVAHDRLHLLAKYTYFYNVPTTDQVSGAGTPVLFLQKSHVAAIDATYDITSWFSLGGKYAYRLGQVSLDRDDPDFFDNNAHLYIVRGDLRFLKHWEATLEGRLLDLPDLDESRSGALVTLYRHLGDHFKVGVGYNFTDFSEDLTDLDYDDHGVFFNLIGTL